MKPLAVIGNLNADLIMGPAVPWPTPGTEVILDHDDLRVGGSAGNTALAWQALGLAFTLAANTGDDVFGRWLAESFAGTGTPLPVHPGGTTLSVGLVHPDGERTFFTTRGHLAHFSLADVEATLAARTLSGGYGLLCGSFLTDRLVADYDRLFDLADETGLSLALDTGWPTDGWTEANRQAVRGWLARCRIALFNEVESTMLTGCDDPVDAAHALRAIMPEGAIAVVKCGPAGAIAVDPQGALYRAAAPAVTVVDTIGAGDVFNAGFLAALAAERPLQACLDDGVAIASRAISTHPRSYLDPSRESGA